MYTCIYAIVTPNWCYWRIYIILYIATIYTLTLILCIIHYVCIGTREVYLIKKKLMYIYMYIYTFTAILYSYII